MASIEALSDRVNPETGKIQDYWRIVDREKVAGAWKKKTTSLGFISKKEAEKALKVYEGRKAAGEEVLPGTVPRSESPTLKAWWSRFVARLKADGKAPGTVTLAEMIGRSILAELGELPLDEVTPAVVDGYLVGRREEGIRGRTLQLEIRHLQQALGLAVTEGKLMTAPTLKMPANTGAKPHVWLSPEQSEAMILQLPWATEPASAVAIYAALETGCRRGELLSRVWSDVRWSQGPSGAIWIGDRVEDGVVTWSPKTGKGRTIPLSSGLREVLLWWNMKRQNDDAGAWLFPSPHNQVEPLGNFRRALASACRRAGVPELHPHAIRHTWATRLAMRGIPRAITMALGGWRSPEMLDEVYEHATDSFSADAVERVSLPAVPPTTNGIIPFKAKK